MWLVVPRNEANIGLDRQPLVLCRLKIIVTGRPSPTTCVNAISLLSTRSSHYLTVKISISYYFILFFFAAHVNSYIVIKIWSYSALVAAAVSEIVHCWQALYALHIVQHLLFGTLDGWRSEDACRWNELLYFLALTRSTFLTFSRDFPLSTAMHFYRLIHCSK